jgi:LemA protein
VLPFLAATVAFAAVTYNRLVALRQRSEAAWADIDVQLKPRADLIPNLVETVRGDAAHEQGTLEAVLRARGAALSAATPEARARAEGELTGALRQLLALAEAYPALQANRNFQALQDALSDIEGAVQDARRYDNAVARDLHTAVERFPANLVAAAFRFARRAYVQLDRPDDRRVPRVSFGR